MDSQVNESFACEVIHQSVNEQIELEFEPIVRQVDRLCALLANRTDLKTTGNNEATDSRCQDASKCQWTTGATVAFKIVLIENKRGFHVFGWSSINFTCDRQPYKFSGHYSRNSTE